MIKGSSGSYKKTDNSTKRKQSYRQNEIFSREIENIKEKTEIMVLKNTMNEMKNATESINS